MSATVSHPRTGRWLDMLLSRQPHQIINNSQHPYLQRWYLLPRNRRLNIYLQTCASSALLNSESTSRVGEFTELCPRVAYRQYVAMPPLSGGLSAVTSGVLPSTSINANERYSRA
jgi:hypothetical protein